MSDGEQELFDRDFDEGRGEVRDIFGQDEANLLDDQVNLEDAGFAAEEHLSVEAPTANVNDISERRKALLQLAKRAKATEDAGPRKKKKTKADKQADGVGSRPQRSKRGQHEHVDEQQRQPQEFVEVNEDEIVETEADKNFIDDDGVPKDERYEEDLERLQAAEEAEEVQAGQEDEPLNIIDEVLQRRKRARKKVAEAEVDAEVMQLTSMMSAVADDDSAAMDSRPPRPAIEKLKHLGEVCSILKQKKFHETFLASKGLNCLAAWLRPYSNGTLPNAKVRAELVGVLKLLQLDTTNDYIRERLEESELGKIIMFYYKNPNESMVLRSECRDLIQAWSAPIFADNDDENRKRRQRERAHRQRQAAERSERERREKQEQEDAERRRKLNPREQGFRARASVPQPSKMDFVINPGRTMDPLEAQKALPAAGGPKSKQAPIGGRLGKMLQQKKRGAQDRIGGVSVEGRGIQL